MGAPSRRLSFLRRLLPLALILAAAGWFFQDAPVDRVLVYDLSARPGLSALFVDVRRAGDGALERHVEFHYSARAPAPVQQRQALRLAQGDYRAEIVLEFGARREEVVRAFTLQKDVEVTLRP